MGRSAFEYDREFVREWHEAGDRLREKEKKQKQNMPYTRGIGKKALVPKKEVLTAIPVSKVLREHSCDCCQRNIKIGELVLRERDEYGFKTTCSNCANWILAKDLL